MMKIPYSRIPRFRPSLDSSMLLAALREIVLPSPGKDSHDFESVFARYIGISNAVCTPSGRMSLRLILETLGLKEKAEVIVPAFTYWAIPAIIRHLNLVPVFVDIDPMTCNLDASLIEKKITPATRAIIPTHLYGLACEMEPIVKIAAKHGLFIIEDCVQAAGAEYAGKKVGSFGDAAYFSFGITKNMPLLGGAMALIRDNRLAQKIRKQISGCSFLNRAEIFSKVVTAAAMKAAASKLIFNIFLFPLVYSSVLKGRDIIGTVFAEKEPLVTDSAPAYFKLFPAALQNKIGRMALTRLEKLNVSRITNARYLLKGLSCAGIVLPLDAHKNVFTSFPIRSAKREYLRVELLKRGIDTTAGFMKAFGDDCPCARALEQEILHLPVYPTLRPKELEYICQEFNQIITRMPQ